jgi:hypothetical protein
MYKCAWGTENGEITSIGWHASGRLNRDGSNEHLKTGRSSGEGGGTERLIVYNPPFY